MPRMEFVNSAELRELFMSKLVILQEQSQFDEKQLSPKHDICDWPITQAVCADFQEDVQGHPISLL